MKYVQPIIATFIIIFASIGTCAWGQLIVTSITITPWSFNSWTGSYTTLATITVSQVNGPDDNLTIPSGTGYGIWINDMDYGYWTLSSVGTTQTSNTQHVFYSNPSLPEIAWYTTETNWKNANGNSINVVLTSNNPSGHSLCATTGYITGYSGSGPVAGTSAPILNTNFVCYPVPGLTIVECNVTAPTSLTIDLGSINSGIVSLEKSENMLIDCNGGGTATFMGAGTGTGGDFSLGGGDGTIKINGNQLPATITVFAGLNTISVTAKLTGSVTGGSHSADIPIIISYQ